MPKDVPKMPDGLEDLLRGLSKAVLKEKPPNILEFSAKYFENLLIERDGSLMKNYERFENYEKSLNKIINQKKTNGDSAKKKVKSAGKNKKTVTDAKVVKSSVQKNEKVSSPIFDDKVVENEPARKSTEATLPRGKLQTRTRSSISLNAITEESNSEMKAERRLMYRNAVQKIQRAFRRYMETKKQNSPALQTDTDSNPPSQPIKDKDEAAKIIQNLFKSKFRKKTPPPPPTQQRPQSIKNKTLERVAESGEDSKSLLEYLQEEENAKKTKPNIEHDSDTGETLTSKVDEMKISKADSLENMIINEDMNRQQNSKNLPLHQEQDASTKIQSTLEHESNGQENVTPIPAAEMIQDANVLYKTQQGEMEQAAVKIQKNYRGYKVRKDILSTKNLVNSGNLVAAAGNIIGSVVNHLSPSISSDKPTDNSETILSEESEIRGTVADTPEFLNKEIASDEMLKLTDPVTNINESKSTDTNLEDAVSSSIPEVSQNTTHDIEPVIGINKQEHETKINKISMDGGKTTEGDFVEDDAPVNGINETKQEINDAPKDFEGVDEPKHQDAITLYNNPALEISLNSETAGTDPQNKNRDVGSGEPKHATKSLDTNASTGSSEPGTETHGNSIVLNASPNESKHELKHVANDEAALQNHSDHDVPLKSTEVRADSPENVTHQNSPVLNDPLGSVEIRTHSPGDSQSLQEGAMDEPKHETKTLATNSTALQRENEEISTDSPISTKNMQDLGTAKPQYDVEPVIDASLNSVEISTDSSGEVAQSVQESVTVDAKHEAKLFAADVTAQNHPVLDTPLNSGNIRSSSPGEVQNEVAGSSDAVALQNHPDPDVPLISTEKQADSPEHIKESHEISTHQNSSGEDQNLQECDTVEPNHETKPLTTDSKALQRETVEIVNDSPVNTQNVQGIGEIRSDSPGDVYSIQEAGLAEPNHEAKHFATDETSQNHPVIDTSLNNAGIRSDSPGKIQNVEVAGSPEALELQSHQDADVLLNSVEKHADHAEQLMESHEVSTHQNSPVLESQSLQGGGTVEPNHDTKPFATESTALQRETVEIINGSPVNTQKVQGITAIAPKYNVEPVINAPLNSTGVRTDSPDEVHSIQEAGSDEPKNEAKLIVTDAIAPLKIAESLTDVHVGIQKVGDNGINTPKLGTGPLATEATIHQNISVTGDIFDSSEVRPHFPGDVQSLQDDRNNSSTATQNVQGLDTVEPQHDISPLAIEATTHQIRTTHQNPDIRADSLNELQIVEEGATIKHETKPLATDPTSLQNHSVLNVPINSEISTDTQNIEEVAHSIDQHTFHNQDSLPDLNDPEMTDAAVKIQKSFRGHQARKETQHKDGSQIRAAHIIPEVTVDGASEEMLSDSEPMDNAKPASKPEMNEAAVKIQKTFRGHQTRKELKEKKANLISAENQLSENLPLSLQPEAKEVALQSETHEEHEQFHTPPDRHNAALKIQKTYRGHQVRKELKQKKAEIVNSADLVGNSITSDNPNPANLTESKDMVQHATNANVENDADSDVKAKNQADNSGITHETQTEPALYTEGLVNPDFTSNKEDSGIDPKQVDAAAKIQKSYRDHKVRKEYKQKKEELQQKKESNFTSALEIEDTASTVDPLQLDSHIPNTDELTNNNVTPEHHDGLPDLNDPEMANAAVKIQKSFRGHQARKDTTNIRKKRSLDFHEEPSNNNLEYLPATNEENGTTQSSLEHRESLPDLNDPEMADAALKIQKSFRGHQARKGSKQQNDDALVKPPIEVADDGLGDALTDISKEDSAVDPADMNNISLKCQESLPDLNDPEMADAALKIQKSFRGHQARKEQKQPILINLSDLPATETADVTSQLTIGDSQQQLLEHEDSLPYLNDPEMAGAALKIQKSFRGHQARRDIKQQKNNKFAEAVEPMPVTTENLDTNEKSLLNMPDPPTPENATEIKLGNAAKEHQDSLPDLTDPEMADAAVKIQKSFRGHQARKDHKKPETQSTLMVEAAVDKPVDSQDLSTAQNEAIDDLSDLPSQSTIAADKEKLVVSSTNQAKHQDSLPDLNDPEMADAAVKIQKSFRGHQARKEQKKPDHQIFSSTDLNQVETLHNNSAETDLTADEGPQLTTVDVNENLVEPDANDPETANAALKIQKTFRGHQARREIKQMKSVKTEESIEPASDTTSNVNTDSVLPKELQDSLPDLKDPNVTNEPLTNLEATMTAQIDKESEIKPRVEYQDSLPDLNDPEMNDAALKIQKSFRGHKARKEASNNKPVPATKNEAVDDTQNDAKVASSLLENQDSLPDLTDPEMTDAALKIQKSFRGHKARKEFKETKENSVIEKILLEATAPPADEPAHQIVEPTPKSDSIATAPNILSSIAPDLIAKATETAAINIQRTYRGYRTRRDLKSQNPSTLVAAATFEDENKLVDSLEPILDQKSNDEDKIDADSLDNFNVEERREIVEEPCQKIVFKSKLSMLIENSKSESNSDKVELKTNDDYFDSLENGQTSEMDESAQTVIEVQQPSSSYEAQNTYDSSLFGIKIEPEEHDEHKENDSVSRKTTAEVDVLDIKVETRGGMTEDEIKEIQNIDLASFEKDSLEAMYYSLRKNELRFDQMHSLSNIEQISDQTEPPRQFTAKQKLLSMGESDSDDIVFKQMSIDYEEYPEISRQDTVRSTTTDDDDADVEVVRDVLYYNDGKQILPNSGEVKREPGDGASVASDNLFDNHSNADDQDVLTKSRAHNFEIFSLDEEIKNLESNVAPHQQDNPLFYAQQKIEKFLHQIHGNRNETEDDADDENDDEFLENPIDSNTSYLSENNCNVEDEEEDDVVDELKNDFRETSGKKILTSAVSDVDSDYIELSRTKPIKDDFNISTALDNYLSTDSDSTYNSAATKIQAGARGFLTRRRIQSINRLSISERRSSIGNAAIDQSLDDMIEENEERKKFKFHEAQSTFREDTITSSGEMEVYGITDIKVEEKKTESPITDSGNESTTSIDTETQSHLRNKYERLENESSFDAIDEDNLNDVVDVIRTSNVQNKLRSPIKNKTLSNLNFDEYERVATRRMTLQRGNAVQGNSTPSDEESRSNPSGSSTATTTASEEKSDQKDVVDGKKTSYDSPIRRKSNDSASLMAKSSNSLPDMQTLPKKRGFIQRQRTMPVQIETEIIRQLPKHMRKRIKSANSSAHSSYHASKKKTTY